MTRLLTPAGVAVIFSCVLAGVVLAQQDVIPHRNLVYAHAGERDLLLDLYLPRQAAAPVPLIVWIHGGGWRSGSKERCPAVRMVSRGYAAASIGYRLSGEAKFPAQIEDCKAAIRWLRANAEKYHLDPDHIGAWGSSAGGHLVALLGTSGGVQDLEGSLGNNGYSSRVQAVVDFFGPTDFLRMSAFPSKIQHDAANSPESLLIGGPIQQNKAKAARANPITYVDRSDPPFLIMHGDQDPLVPPNQSELLEQALRKAGVEVTLRVLHGAGHGGPQFQSTEVRRMVEEFFARHLKTGTSESELHPQLEVPRIPRGVDHAEVR
jgi:acetyl esterase/lipase